MYDELTGRLAEFASAVDLARLGVGVRHAGRRSFANVVGLAVDAAAHPAVDAVATGLARLGMSGDIRVLGSDRRTSAYASALLTGYAMHVEDFDDTHLETVLHPGAPVVAAALAAAQLCAAAPADVLAATIAGIEVGSRLGIALGPGHFDRGWHVTGTVGHVAAAAAAARMLRLDADATAAAMAIAAAQASGVTEQLGSMTKALHVGRSAANGLRAAELARSGMRGVEPFGGIAGMAAAMSTRYDPDRALHKLGEAWETELNAFKPYSCGIVSHPVIDAAVRARAAGIGAADVERATVVVRPVVLEVMGIKEPRDGLQSKFSVYHCFAVGLLDGGAGPAQYSDARATAADVVDLRRKVEAVLDPRMAKDACRLEIDDRRGGRRRFEVEHASGSAQAPMTDAQLAAKFGLLVGPRLGPERGERLWHWAIGLDSVESVDELYELASVPEGAR